MKIGLVSQMISILGPFIVRTVFIHTLGSQYLGLNGLFGSILSVLNLTELGFGSAVVFSMYQAIAEDDDDLICALLLFFKKSYRIIGLIILTVGLCLIPALPHLIHGSWPPDINLTAVYLIFLLDTVSSYFMFSYLGSLFAAFQRVDIGTRVGMYFNLVKFIIQIVILVTSGNYYLYIIVMPVFTLLTNLRTAILARKVFPQYVPKGSLDKKTRLILKEKVGGLLINKICAASRNSFDSIFVSMFLGLTEIAIYNNYLYIMNSVIGVISIITGSVIAGAGNSVASDSAEKNHHDMMRMNFGYMWLSGWCTVCLACLYQPFVRIWAGSGMLMQGNCVALLCVYFYILKMGDIRSVYVQAKGIWWETRFRALAEASANITLNYFLGKQFGLAGIIAATLISLFFINFCYGSHLIYKYYFTEQKPMEYFKFHGFCALITAIITAVSYIVCGFVPDSIVGFLARMIICIIVPNVLFFLIYRKTKMYSDAMPWILEKIGLPRTKRIF